MTGRPATAQHVRDLARPRRVRNRTGSAKKTTSTKGWTAEERAAAKAYAQERKAEARGENDEGAALAAIAAMSKPDRTLAERYATFGFNDTANLDQGTMWPTSFALTKLTAADEKKIAALVKKAVS